jgi:outer membrane biosynthesis protein TonB
MDAVSEVLVDRSKQADKVAQTMVLSLVAHAALIALVTFVPGSSSETQTQPRVMTISLGGAPGPLQGRNPISSVPKQQVVPETVKPAVNTTPAAAKPELIEPTKSAPVAPKAAVKPETKDARGRTPTKGAEVTTGTAKVETGSRTQTKFGGLATGGGGAGAAYTDYADFCCPEYLEAMVQVVHRNWQAKQGQDGTNIAKFTISRDGTITNVMIEQGTNQLLNLASQRALVQTKKLAPLPAAFTPPQLTVYLVFQYQR